MELYILDKDYEKVAVIDATDSTLWNKKYNSSGYSEIYIPCSNEMLAILQEGYYIYRYDDDMVCQIEAVEITTSVEDGDYIIASATDICKKLSGRIVWDKLVFSGSVGEFIKKVLNDNVINSNQRIRNITRLEFDESNLSEINENITMTLEGGEDILQVITTTCNTYNIGFRLTFDIDKQKLVFRLYKGKNKAAIESDEYVEFSPTYSNILSSNYKEDASNYKNYAIVGAKDVDESLMYITVYQGNTEPSGEDRKEVYIDATSTSRDITLEELQAMFPTATLNGNTYYVDISGVPIAIATVDGDKLTVSDFTYQKILNIIGRNALANHIKTQKFTGEVDTIDTYEYKTDYNLGDIVKVVNEYGITSHAQITEIMESDDLENGYQIEPKFEYIN